MPLWLQGTQHGSSVAAHNPVMCLLDGSARRGAVSPKSRALALLVLAHVVSSLRLILPLEGSPLDLILVGLLSIGSVTDMFQ